MGTLPCQWVEHKIRHTQSVNQAVIPPRQPLAVNITVGWTHNQAYSICHLGSFCLGNPSHGNIAEFWAHNLAYSVYQQWEGDYTWETTGITTRTTHTETRSRSTTCKTQTHKRNWDYSQYRHGYDQGWLLPLDTTVDLVCPASTNRRLLFAISWLTVQTIAVLHPLLALR